MNDKLIKLLAIDILLLKLDEDYEKLSQEKHDLIYSKILESYGLNVHSTSEELKEIKNKMIKDVQAFRDELINQII